MAAITRPIQSSAASSCVQGPSSSALVLEYVCLFTHDLRRKQKRWQDGRIKFHAFNKRIMVYDERGNFIGDTHWREDHEFGDGEEIELERGGTIVQAAECVGSRSQDLSELIDKRVQEKVQRYTAAAAHLSRPAPRALAPVAPLGVAPHSQLQHKSLPSLIGTPTGHHGRALLPTESPFEERQKLNAERSLAQQDESPHPAKRRKRAQSPPSKSGYAQSLFGAPLNLSGRPMSSVPVRHQPKKTLPTPLDDHAPASSSDLGYQHDDHDDGDVWEVPLPVAAVYRRRPVPLSERSAAATNIPRLQPDVLAGKNARPTANVPSLLLHRNPRREQGPADSIKPRARSVSKAKSFASTPDIQLDPCSSASEASEFISVRPRRDNIGLGKASRQHPSERPSTKNVSNQAAVGIDRSLLAANGDLSHRHGRAQTKSHALQRDSSQPAQDSAELEDPSIKPAAVHEPRIELRIQTRKKRGLLMMSEKGTTKKSRIMAATDQSSSQSGASSQTVASNGGGFVNDVQPSRAVKLNQSDSAWESGDQRRGHRRPTLESFATVDATFVTDTPIIDMTTDELHAQRHPIPLGEDARGTGGAVLITQTDHGLTNEASIPKRADSLSHRAASREEQVSSSSEDPFEEMIPKRQTRQCLKRRKEETARLRRQSPVYASRIDTDAVEGLSEDHAAARRQEPTYLGKTTTIVRKVKRLFAGRNNPTRRRLDDLPPPRLAPLSRKSIRSKEVIGLYHEDEDELPIQRKGQIGQGMMWAPRQDLPAAVSPAILDNTPSQTAREAMQQRVRIQEDPHQTSSANRAGPTGQLGNLVQQKIGSNLPGIAGPLEDQSASIARNALVDPGLGSVIAPLTGQSEAAAQPPPILSKPERSLCKVKDQLVSCQEKNDALSGPVAVRQVDQGLSRPTALPNETENASSELKDVTCGSSMPSSRTTKQSVSPNKQERPVTIPAAMSNVEKAVGPPQGSDPVHTNPHPEVDSGLKRQTHLLLTPTRSNYDPSLENLRPQLDTVCNEATGKLAANHRQVPKLVNPATRGKKAAKPSDTAGQVPERIRSTSGNVAVAREVERHVVCATDTTAKESPALPCFPGANAGAWSREAHDLFEYRRPN